MNSMPQRGPDVQGADVETNELPSVYTAGYRGHTLNSLVTTAARLDALVVDIRLSPRSPQSDWQQHTLKKRLGSRYHHLVELGNLNYSDLSKPVALMDAKLGVAKLLDLARDRRCILLCACVDYGRCHRKTVADLLREGGCDVRELEWIDPVHAGPLPTNGIEALL